MTCNSQLPVEHTGNPGPLPDFPTNCCMACCDTVKNIPAAACPVQHTSSLHSHSTAHSPQSTVHSPQSIIHSWTHRLPLPHMPLINSTLCNLCTLLRNPSQDFLFGGPLLSVASQNPCQKTLICLIYPDKARQAIRCQVI